MRSLLALLFVAAVIPLGGCAGEGAKGGGSTEWRFSPPLQTYSEEERLPPELCERLAAASTVNVDAPGLLPSCRTATNDAFASIVAATSRGTLVEVGRDTAPGAARELTFADLMICVSVSGATFSLDGFPAEPIDRAPIHPRGWTCASRVVAAGAHSLRFERPGYFPVETQVIVGGDGAIVAARLAKAVAREGIAKPPLKKE